jgi:CRISPR-associated protein Csy1
MPDPSERQQEFRNLIEEFLRGRLNPKLEKLDSNDIECSKLLEQYQTDTWINNAASRVSQLQMATHVLKGTHGDAKGTNLYCIPKPMQNYSVVGSHCLDAFVDDVVGNAAQLDVYGFLRLELDGKTLLEWMEENDQDLAAVLSSDTQLSSQLVKSFTDIKVSRGAVKSHTFAKQIYWLTGDDPADDNQFHILAPLFASSLAHEIYRTVEEHRFGESAKLAREAKRNNLYSETAIHEYPRLAVQKLGGTKPQNISQLNSERKGRNYQLASLPPVWQQSRIRPPLGTQSIFAFLGRQQRMRELLLSLRKFLESDPPANVETREKRDNLLNEIKDELHQYVAQLHTLEPGWSKQASCKLEDCQKLWLDPFRAALEPDFSDAWHSLKWTAEIVRSFANWINDQIGKNLPLGDIESAFWSDLFDDENWCREIDSYKQSLETKENRLA